MEFATALKACPLVAILRGIRLEEALADVVELAGARVTLIKER